MKKIIKVIVEIENDRIGSNIRGELTITDMLFNDHESTMDAEQMVKDVKQSIKLLRGFRMITIRMTENEYMGAYHKEMHSVRITNHYGEMKISNINADGTMYGNWKECKLKDIYNNVNGFVYNANAFHSLNYKEAIA